MTLRDRLIARIRARGPMSFADYMEASLYDPDDGYYSTRVALGFEGDYLTAPDLSPHFGRSLSRAFADQWTILGRPASWDLVEAGAGRGTLLRDVLTSLERERPDAAKGVRPAIVEVSTKLRREQAHALDGRDLRWASEPRALAPLHGVIYANEILDAFPVHVLVRTDDGIREVYVEEKDGRLVEILRTPNPGDLRYRVPEHLPLGGRWEVSVRAESWVAGLAAAMTRGYVIFVDYGGDEVELLTRLGTGTVRGFSRHRLLMDPFADPGAHDLTASVNFTAIRRAAEGAGFTFVGRTSQRDMLLALGIRDVVARPSTPIDQLRAFSQRSAVDTLLEPSGFGGFQVVCFAKDAPIEGLRIFAPRTVRA
ncbi:MAG TPA: SAM-dependent methyltransferase [Candidatus Limnocylindrales bacterium]|nr:SAM-dependent methyltransferase [Candidatus Limnocylindrales bacterium]